MPARQRSLISNAACRQESQGGSWQISIVNQEGIRSAAGFMCLHTGAHYHNCRSKALLPHNEDLTDPWHKAEAVPRLELANPFTVPDYLLTTRSCLSDESDLNFNTPQHLVISSSGYALWAIVPNKKCEPKRDEWDLPGSSSPHCRAPQRSETSPGCAEYSLSRRWT